jgi:hypothetical protein
MIYQQMLYSVLCCLQNNLSAYLIYNITVGTSNRIHRNALFNETGGYVFERNSKVCSLNKGSRSLQVKMLAITGLKTLYYISTSNGMLASLGLFWHILNPKQAYFGTV